ncbi:MAG: hypothetical protein D6788_09670 [Planctomycetota bacterium]|nr:MAG: hypothetical protein D6788_09670 [Planctomycetota bacterium]
MKGGIRWRTILVVSGLLPAGIPIPQAALCPDNDGDGYADCTVPGCDPTGVTCGDCADDDYGINPGAVETCDHVDEDCDGAVDEGFPEGVGEEKVMDGEGESGDDFGWSVAGIGDVTGDGVPDVVVGVPGDDVSGVSNAGSVVLLSGADLSVVCRMSDPGGASGDELGYAVAGIGDVTGDGTEDIAASAIFDDTLQGTNAGSVLIFSGADCSLVRKCTDPDGAESDELGFALDGLRDISGDGVPEVVAGVPLDDTAQGTNAGSVVVFSGSDCSVVFKLTDALADPQDRLGEAVAGLEDVTGDGTADIAAGAYLDDTFAGTNAGSVVIFSGADGSFVRRLTDSGGAASDELGRSVAGIGDVTGDGIEDIAAGAYLDDTGQGVDTGSVVVFSGADGAEVMKCEDLDGSADDELGVAVAGLRDITGDGKPEIVAGAFLDDTLGGADAGSVVVFSGADCSVVRKLTDADGLAGDELGYAVTVVGDLSGDGVPEIVAGARYADEPRESEPNLGSVVIFALESDCDGDGVTPYGGDCEDADADLFAGNAEACDVKDNDCDGSIDEDGDADGFGVCDDCDDGDPRVFPGAVELCNGVDDDCDGSIDEGPDGDNDGYEAPCDCDDGDGSIHPGAVEVCNHVDDNCDGQVDEGFSSLTTAEKVLDPQGLAGDEMGQSIAAIGDVTGDGVPDFAVGAPFDDTSAGTNSGSVIVFSGADRSFVCKGIDPDAASGDELGYSVAGIGDVTGDGVPDIVAGAYLDNTSWGDAGSVVVFSGADCSFVRKCTDTDPGGRDYLGCSVAALGDITGDGVPEIVAGAWGDDTSRGNDRGSALVFSGADCTLVLKLEDRFGAYDDELGYAVAGLEDVTGDGVPDIAVGARLDDTQQGNHSGSVIIFSGADGSIVRKLIDPDGPGGDQLGTSVAGVGDVDGDGVEDVAAGAPYVDLAGGYDAGAVVIFSGADGSVIRKCSDPDFGAADHLGTAISGAPDLNGDGVPEILAGVPYDDIPGAGNAGSVVVFSGANCSVVDKLTDPDAAYGDELGTSVAAVGDLDGDGVTEIAAGAPLDDVSAATSAGSVSVFATESDCDGDGCSPFCGDCDDVDSSRYPGAVESCDGKDNDCDVAIDEDNDADGFDACNDCDNANADVWSTPGECRDLMFAGDRQTLTWQTPVELGGNLVVYDTIRSGDSSDFVTNAFCVESDDGSDTSATDASSPAAGAAFYYLVRAENDCPDGQGSLGRSSAGQERTARACP